MATRFVTREDQPWVVQDLGEGWTAEYRLALDGAASVVVAELRVVHDGDAVPIGGLPARSLRRMRLGDALAYTREALVLLQPAEVVRPTDVAATPEGVTAMSEEARRRPGRSGHGDGFYVAVAATYARAALESRHATKEVAQRLNISPSRARELIATARKRELLTETKQGRAGGRLTKRAREILDVLDVAGIASAEAFGTPAIKLGPPPKRGRRGE